MKQVFPLMLPGYTSSQDSVGVYKPNPTYTQVNICSGVKRFQDMEILNYSTSTSKLYLSTVLDNCLTTNTKI